jgi:hypothetical protein
VVAREKKVLDWSTLLSGDTMDDAYRAGWHASQIRAVAVDLERILPTTEWEGPAALQCQLRVREIRDDLNRVARLLESSSREPT